MPKVPVIQRQVAETGLPSVSVATQVPGAAFGRGEAQITQQLGRTVAGVVDLASRHQKQANVLKVTEVENDFVRSLDDLQYNSKTGLMNRAGKNAFGISEEFDDGFGVRLQDSINELNNDAQKDMFRLIAQEHKVSANKNLDRRMSSEIKKHQINTADAFIQNQVIHAQRNYANIPEIEVAAAKADSKLQQLAAMQGLSAEEIKLRQQKNNDQIFGGVLARYIDNGDDQNAKALFKKFKDKISPDAQDKIKKGIDTIAVRGESQRKTDALMVNGLGISETLEAARKIKDPRVRDETVKRVKSRFNELKEIIRLQAESAHNKAFRIIDKSPNMDLIPESLKADLSPQQLTSLDSYVTKKSKGVPIKTDDKLFFERMTEASSPLLKDNFLKRDLLLDRPKLSDSDWRKLINLQAGLRTGDAKAMQDADGFRSDTQVVIDVVRDIGFKKDSPEASLFRREVDRRVQAWKQEQGKKQIPNSELIKITDALAVSGTIEGSGIFFDDRKRMFQLKAGEELSVDIDDVPERDRSEIIEALRSRGITETDDKIIELFLEKNRRVLINVK